MSNNDRELNFGLFFSNNQIETCGVPPLILIKELVYNDKLEEGYAHILENYDLVNDSMLVDIVLGFDKQKLKKTAESIPLIDLKVNDKSDQICLNHLIFALSNFESERLDSFNRALFFFDNSSNDMIYAVKNNRKLTVLPIYFLSKSEISRNHPIYSEVLSKKMNELLKLKYS